MIFYSVVEDFDGKTPYNGEVHWENQTIALCRTQKDAELHLSDNLPDDFRFYLRISDGVVYKRDTGYPTPYEATSIRRIKQIEISNLEDYLSGGFMSDFGGEKADIRYLF